MAYSLDPEVFEDDFVNEAELEAFFNDVPPTDEELVEMYDYFEEEYYDDPIRQCEIRVAR